MLDTDLNGRTFLVTGANTGIGRATVEALAARGASVVLAARSEERTRPVLEALASKHPGAATFLSLDLADLASVRRAAETFLASGRPLDVLINNAGLAGTRGMTRDGFDMTIGTNHLGPFLLTELLLPRLLEAGQGRIVNVSSRAHRRVRRIDWDDFRRPAGTTGDLLVRYGLSKLMNILHARELGRRLEGTRVTTCSLHPGGVASEIWRELPQPFRAILNLLLLSNEEGARTSVYCATSPDLSAVSGGYFERCGPARTSALAEDRELASELFAWSEEAIRSVHGRG